MSIATLDGILRDPNVLASQARIVSVLDFGAVPDGTTDNTAAFNAALAARGATGVLVIPPGTYNFAGAIPTIPGTVDLLDSGAVLMSAGVPQHRVTYYHREGEPINVLRETFASGSAQSTTGSITAGSNILTVASAIDFKVGQGIAIPHAGPLPSIGAPAAAPTVTPAGTTGSTSYSYALCYLDGKGGYTAGGPVATITNGNATLSAVNYNAISWPAPPSGVVFVAVLRTASGGTPSTTGLIAVLPAATTGVNDTGLAPITSLVTYLQATMAPVTLPSSLPSAPAGQTLVTQIVAGGGTTVLTLKDAASNTVSGATVLHSDTAAINAALNAASVAATSTGKTQIVELSRGQYVVDGPLVQNAGVILRGEDKNSAALLVYDHFDFTAAGVWTFFAVAPVPMRPSTDAYYPKVESLTIDFAQPDTASLSQIIQYPYALNPSTNQGGNRFRFCNLHVNRAWNTVNMKSNVGGATIEDLEHSFFNIGIDIDGPQDIVRFRSVHAWVFGMTANQENLFYASATAVQSGRCDGLFMSECFAICRTGLNLYASSTGNTFGSAVGCGFDTQGALTMSDGDFSVSGSYFNIGNTASQAIIVSGGSLNLSACSFQMGATLTNPMVQVTSAGEVRMAACKFLGFSNDQEFIRTSSNFVDLVACEFDRNANVTYSTPMVHKVSGRMSATACRTNDQGTGTCTFFQVDTDDWDYIAGNPAPGRPSTWPSTITYGRYEDGSVYPAGVTTPAIPASGTAYANTFGVRVRVFVSGGTVTAIAINGTSTGLTSGSFELNPSETITLTYTAAPRWVWLRL
jgi:hypothetical protein